MRDVLLSVIIPAYDEERRIPGSLALVTAHLESRGDPWEVVVVDDGSEDGTARAVEAAARQHPGVRLVRAPHRGKGAALRLGMLEATGSFRFMCDADLSMPVEQIDRFLPPAIPDADIVIASREAAESRRIGEPARRHLLGRGFNWLVRLAAVPGIHDTQCGFKCFRGSVAETLFSMSRLDGFAFDVEILFLARRHGFKIVEVPIDWYYREESKVSAVSDSFRMFRDVLRVRWNQLRGAYRPPS